MLWIESKPHLPHPRHIINFGHIQLLSQMKPARQNLHIAYKVQLKPILKVSVLKNHSVLFKSSHATRRGFESLRTNNQLLKNYEHQSY